MISKIAFSVMNVQYLISVEAEKTEKEVRRNALLAAQYFKILDNNISPNKPLTWMLIRPPWSNSVKMICLKQAIFNQLVKTKVFFISVYQ